MKGFIYFTVGLVVGVWLVKQNQTIDDLKRDLENE
ncbi:hypothetical protein PEC301899_13720 [Pectobacterium carotovorum subsp. carotovorum]|nr:hypothetical protein PEC301899_13720 [Pectobacterium carotovorum subsp. carotovorum]